MPKRDKHNLRNTASTSCCDGAAYKSREGGRRCRGRHEEQYIRLRSGHLTIADQMTAAAAKALLTPSERFGGERGMQAEKNRRRKAFKKQYDRFADESEERRTRVGSIVHQNDRRKAEIQRNNQTIAANVIGDVRQLQAENEAMSKEIERSNKEMKGDVDGASQDIKMQQKWDDFFELRSDEPAC